MKRAKCQRCGERPAKAPHLPLCEACLYADAMRSATRVPAVDAGGKVIPLPERKAKR